MRPNPLMAMVVMTVYENADAALPPDGGIVHAQRQASIFGAKTMEIRKIGAIAIFTQFSTRSPHQIPTGKTFIMLPKSDHSPSVHG